MEVAEGSASYGSCDYDAIAAQYDSLHKDPKSLQEDLAIAGFLREYVAPGCKVLDLGCGTGLLHVFSISSQSWLLNVCGLTQDCITPSTCSKWPGAVPTVKP